MAHLRGRSGSSGAVRRLRLLTVFGGLSAAFRGPAGPRPHRAASPRSPPSPPTHRFPPPSFLPPPPRLLKRIPAPAEVARQSSPGVGGQGGISPRGGGLGGARRFRARTAPPLPKKPALRLQPRQAAERRGGAALSGSGSPARPRNCRVPLRQQWTGNDSEECGGPRRMGGEGGTGGAASAPLRARGAPWHCPGGF